VNNTRFLNWLKAQVEVCNSISPLAQKPIAVFKVWKGVVILFAVAVYLVAQPSH
jgi:hypothetical protein